MNKSRRSSIQIIFGLFGVVVGILLGIYVGFWLCFIGGILGLVQVVNELVDGSGLNGMLIVWSILKLMFAGLAGYISAMVILIPSWMYLNRI